MVFTHSLNAWDFILPIPKLSFTGVCAAVRKDVASRFVSRLEAYLYFSRRRQKVSLRWRIDDRGILSPCNKYV